MDYPQTVENFLLAYPEFKDFSEAITAYSLFIESRNDERCYVCKATLTSHEQLTLTPYDFQITCGRHRHLKNIFNLQAYCHQNKSPESVEGVAEIFDKRISSCVAESKEDEESAEELFAPTFYISALIFTNTPLTVLFLFLIPISTYSSRPNGMPASFQFQYKLGSFSGSSKLLSVFLAISPSLNSILILVTILGKIKNVTDAKGCMV